MSSMCFNLLNIDMSDSLKYIERAPKTEHKATIIWIHGLGDSGFGHEPIVDVLNLTDELGLKFILPHAPEQPVTVNGGMVMPSWYDILEMDIDRKIDEEGIGDSARKIQDIINSEIELGIPSGNIIVAGFSQGGAVALQTAFTATKKYAGVICMSTYLGVPSILDNIENNANKDIEVFWGHGNADPVVSFSLAKDSVSLLEKAGIKCNFNEYGIDHSISPDELHDIRSWIISLECFKTS